jgi:ubiquitin C-terminal hydrolase
VEHSGTLKSGHYVAFVRGPPAQSQTGLKNDAGSIDNGASSWYYISDSHVHQTTLDAVLQSEAYLVFYERVDTIGVSHDM